MTLPPGKLGDKGQRYAVSVHMPDGEVIAIGWGDSPDAFRDAIAAHPGWRRGKRVVTDRWASDGKTVDACRSRFGNGF